MIPLEKRESSIWEKNSTQAEAEEAVCQVPFMKVN